LALVRLEYNLKPHQQFLLITQNIDGLHQKAGSQNVVELHGTVRRTRCTNDSCISEPFTDNDPHDKQLPRCSTCQSPLRPDIVLFNEEIPPDASWQSKRALRDCDLFIAVGTSGTVSPASNFVRSADYAGARTILVNLEPMNPKNPYFKEEYLGKAEEVLPTLI
jgi:NAD-dependent deacetylase